MSKDDFRPMTHAPDALRQEEITDVLLRCKETCELLRGWSYHVMDREVFPRLEELKTSFEHSNSHEEAELLGSVFGSVTTLDEFALNLRPYPTIIYC